MMTQWRHEHECENMIHQLFCIMASVVREFTLIPMVCLPHAGASKKQSHRLLRERLDQTFLDFRTCKCHVAINATPYKDTS